MGMVKSIKRGQGWSRVEIMDSTGVVGIFDEEETKLEPGRTYLILAGSNRIAEAIPIDELDKHKDSPMIRFLNFKTIPFASDEYFVLSFKPRITKTGKRIASLVVADSNREMISSIVFPTSFAMAYTRIEEGGIYEMTFSKTKDGDIALKEVGNVN